MMSQTENQSVPATLGRPPLPEEKRRTHQVTVRLTGEEIDAIVSASQDKRLAEAVREFALERARKKFGIKTEN